MDSLYVGCIGVNAEVAFSLVAKLAKGCITCWMDHCVLLVVIPTRHLWDKEGSLKFGPRNADYTALVMERSMSMGMASVSFIDQMRLCLNYV